MSERTWFAMAAIGRDRPGIVADLSECVFECGCNLEDASMTMLGNEFATLMLVSGAAPDTRERLYEATKRLEWERRLTVFVRPLDAPPPGPSEATPATARYTLSAVGVDKAGIVAGVARCLAEHGVVISDLRGSVSHVPQSGTLLYTLELRMSVPGDVAIDVLEVGLDAVAERLGIEVSVTAVDDD